MNIDWTDWIFIIFVFIVGHLNGAMWLRSNIKNKYRDALGEIVVDFTDQDGANPLNYQDMFWKLARLLDSI
ncbi:hypothetical protein LCGC14_1586820 [marine sediment metagenome]|uniref:Uncharacterized protein n=1 Tax=marine sediment metagenome TaxID=412755 RepID=A0A0F9IF54_9ZZZZ